jgi:ArsR family transcriptional regulator, lead/cadmium/zinc/bismuth-responsive transcriptional repressor
MHRRHGRDRRGAGRVRDTIARMHRLSALDGVPVVDPAQVCDARTVLADAAQLRRTAGVLGALGELNRLSIMLALRHAGDLCVSDLAVVVGMSDSAVSHALRLLRAHGMVSAHRHGRLVRYRVTGELTHRLLDVVSEDVVGDVVLHAHDPGRDHRQD